MWLSPNEATFLPRIRVLGDADPLDLFAAYGTRMNSTQAAIALLDKALAIPPAFTELERQIHLSAFALEAAERMRSTKTAPGERLYPDLPAVSAAAIAREIAGLIDEAHNEAADLSRIDKLDNSQSTGGEQLSLQLLRHVRRSWDAHKRESAGSMHRSGATASWRSRPSSSGRAMPRSSSRARPEAWPRPWR